MSTLGDGLNLANWITKRIDQVSAWMKKRERENVIKKIDNAVTNRDATTFDKLMRDVEEKRYKRTSAS